MLKELTLPEFLDFAKTAKRVAIYREILADKLTPIKIVENLSIEMKEGVILEFNLKQPEAHRYSIIAFESIAQFIVKNNQVSSRIGKECIIHDSPPFVALRKMMSELSYANNLSLVNFLDGGIGFVSYDSARLFESIPDRHPSLYFFPEINFNFYRNTLFFDHMQQTVIINVIADVGQDPQKSYETAKSKIEKLINKITQDQHVGSLKSSGAGNRNSPVENDIDDSQFVELVERAKKYIISGEAFQIVLSRCFKKAYSVNFFDIYRSLRKISNAPYLFCIPYEDKIIIGASPEKLIGVHNRQVTINPIAGTRRRLADQDDQITDELLSNKKERAEHIMLVDLARNDLGGVCEPGSIEVTQLLQVKHFSHVSHMTSIVTGKLCNSLDAFDAFIAAFPAGTLSGAPKIRAMQIIDELENSRREIYGGAICRFDFNGNFDSCISIRMAVLENGIATIRAGAGVVADSNPQSEAEETWQKAQELLTAIELAEAGIG